jgi:nitrite reductase/ring-hydroxylating ferredoxin subunit
VSGDVLARDEATLFRRAWQFVALGDRLARDGDYVTTRLGDRSVVVRRFGDELRAFHDVCAHRSARIHRESCGNGPFRCPYHGWTYDREGVPVGIPHREDFSELTRVHGGPLALSRCSVDVLGPVVFARFEPTGEPLVERARALEPLRELLGPPLLVAHEEIAVAMGWHEAVASQLEAPASAPVAFVFPNLFASLDGTAALSLRMLRPTGAATSVWSCDRFEVSAGVAAALERSFESTGGVRSVHEFQHACAEHSRQRNST